MAYWNEISELIHKVDEEGLQIYVNTYELPEGGEILVFDDNRSADEFNSMLREVLREYPEVKKEIEDAIYDVDNRGSWYLDLATEDSWTYLDEGFLCDECYKWHYFYERNACSYANYFVGDGYIICEDCLKESEEYREEYLRERIDNYKDANTILTDSELEELGFEKVNDYPFANGFYQGENDQPEKILKKVREKYPNEEFLFSIVKDYNPFHTEFNLYKREVA